MSNLTQTAYVARKGINVAILSIVLIIVVRMLFGVAFNLWQQFFPPPPPTPTVAFGKLPYPNAQNSVATPSGMTVSIETIDGSLPKLPTLMKVFFIDRPSVSFGYKDRMLQTASQLGFSGSPTLLRSSVWRFVDSGNPLRSMDMDEITQQYRIVYNYVADPGIFSTKTFFVKENVIGDAKSVFSGPLLQKYSVNEPILTSFSYDAGVLVPATSLSNADAVAVSFVHNDIEKTPVVSPDWTHGIVSTILSGASDNKRKQLEVRMFDLSIDEQNWATYPIITSQQAYDLLSSGQAIFSAIPTPKPDSFVVRKAFVAYLMPYPAQSFLQPVMVFTDERGLIAYVPLVNSEWMGNE